MPLLPQLPALWLIVNCKNGISSYEIARDLGVTQKSAWFMLQRLRLALKSRDFSFKLGGTGGPVEVDECFIGPKPQAMHADRRLKLKKAANGFAEKTAVVGMLNRDTRQVRAKMVPNVKRETLQNEILAQIEGKSTIYTDGYVGYDNLKAQEFIHDTVNHVDQYVKGSAGRGRSLRFRPFPLAHGFYGFIVTQ
jgi:transposase-like protein